MMQQYLHDGNQDKARIWFNFRMGNHTLPVERMRYFGATRRQRICKNAGCREVGDERHVFYCQGNSGRMSKIWRMLEKHEEIPECFRREANIIAEYWEKRGGTEGGEQLRRERTWVMQEGIRACFQIRTKMITDLIKQYWTPRTSPR